MLVNRALAVKNKKNYDMSKFFFIILSILTFLTKKIKYEEFGIYEPLIDNLTFNEVRTSFGLLPVVLLRGK